MDSNVIPLKVINIFYCYAHEDRKQRNILARHLSNLRWQGLIIESHSFDISPGLEWEKENTDRLDNADIILLLITKDFMASYHIHEVEMRRAIERHKAKTARVIPIHLRPVDWENAPFSKLRALPTNAKPVTTWSDRDEAYVDICEGIKRVVSAFLGDTDKNQPKQPVLNPSAGTSTGLFNALPNGAISQILVEHKPFSQRPQRQSNSSNHLSQNIIDTPPSIYWSQNMREESDNWLHFRWLILGTAIATFLLYAIAFVFHMTAITELWLIPWAICLILGVVETSHFGQWYWFVGFLVISPLIGSLYAVVRPDVKPHRPINVKQLIIMVSYLGYALCFVALIIGQSFQALVTITAYIGIAFIVSAWLIRVIHHMRLKGFREEDIMDFFFPFTIPFAALIGLSKLDNQLNELEHE